MREHLPLLVGNVQGVPYSQRNTANRDALDGLKENPEYDGWDRNLQQIDRSLGMETEDDLGSDGAGSDGPPRMLLSLDVGQRSDHGWEQQPLASVSVGDPDTADTTTFGAAGMGSGTHNMQDEVETTEELQRDLEEAGGGSHAAVSWVGYDPPPEMWDSDWSSVLGDERASAGGWDFAYALDGFHETRSAGDDGDGDFTVNVHAHSYGTNMSAHALTRTAYEVDAFAMYGSSGIPSGVADQASDFNVARDRDGESMVFASESWADTTAGMGRVGSWGSRIDPTTLGFGAQEHYSRSMYGRDDSDLADVTDHGRVLNDDDPDEYGYLDPSTTHYRNLTYILSGKHDDIYGYENHLDDLG